MINGFKYDLTKILQDWKTVKQILFFPEALYAM